MLNFCAYFVNMNAPWIFICPFKCYIWCLKLTLNNFPQTFLTNPTKLSIYLYAKFPIWSQTLWFQKWHECVPIGTMIKTKFIKYTGLNFTWNEFVYIYISFLLSWIWYKIKLDNPSVFAHHFDFIEYSLNSKTYSFTISPIFRLQDTFHCMHK
jgi:hypothetical protein